MTTESKTKRPPLRLIEGTEHPLSEAHFLAKLVLHLYETPETRALHERIERRWQETRPRLRTIPGKDPRPE
jgi:hypothetical protein